jgi:hypothetical protein
MVSRDCHLTKSDLNELLGKYAGTGYTVSQVDRLRGGAQKVVYKVECDGGAAFILYVWDLAMNYFQEERKNDDPLEESYGCGLFEENTRFLQRLGVRSPEVLHIERAGERYAFDFALVEYVEGEQLERYFDRDPKICDDVLGKFGEMLGRMHSYTRAAYGKVHLAAAPGASCQNAIYDNAGKQLSFAARHLAAVARHEDRLGAKLDELYAAIKPRSVHGFIHGELGPDHVLVNERLEPILIDIEGAMFFDVEHEHSFMQLRFGERYRMLERPGLDPDRMRFYMLHHHLSVTAGGIKLLQRGFPDRKFAASIARYNARCALRFLE